MNPVDTIKKITLANIDYHTVLSSTYDEDSPHFKPENQERLRAKIKDFSQKTKGGKLLDAGCGTGFILNIAKDYFEEVVGLDITPAMIEKVKKETNVKTVVGDLYEMPFEDNSFEVCTAYGVLHHLYDPVSVIKEAYRCLKPGGYFYSDSDPNRYFFEAIYNLTENKNHSDIIQREIEATKKEEEMTSARYKMDKNTIRLAEYQKISCGGLDGDKILQEMEKIGFKNIILKYEWFLGQAQIMHGKSFELAEEIEAYLTRALPVSKALFKYLSFIAIKE